MTVGEYIKFNNISYNGSDIFEVYSLGNGLYGTEEYYVNIFNYGYVGTTFNPGKTGTFKRVINIANSAETMSSYYVKKHKILTNVSDSVLVKSGFELNIFDYKVQFQASALTPNYQENVVVKNGNQSYTLSFGKDVNLNGLVDNQKRPVTELYYTIIHKGYFGWFYPSASYKIKEGFEFNLEKQTINGILSPNNYWLSTSSINQSNDLTLNSYTSNGKTFNYVNSLKSGNTIDGSFCEWNDYEQKERVISEIYHKLTYNPNVFNVISSNGLLQDNPLGFYYKPHYSIKIRDFSDYVERGTPKEVVGVPDYSYFSTADNEFRWRDIYTYGFIDNQGNGVNYPFFNDTHYPYESYTFRIIPEGTNYIESDINYYANLYGSASPIVDNCE
jgi:hypothetical protein